MDQVRGALAALCRIARDLKCICAQTAGIGMRGKPAKAAQFLAAMEQAEPSSLTPPPRQTATSEGLTAGIPKPSSRAGLKHFGGYLDDETLEKIALLRARLKKDNSALIKLAIDDLYRRHEAKRAFGDS
jgi:hypothetical protein